MTHGTPSEPEIGERSVAGLAARVRRLAPEIDVRAATLAAGGHLEQALAATGNSAPVVYPMFMADGWFVRQAIPRRLAGAGLDLATVAAPFGRDPRLPALCLDAATRTAAARGWRPGETRLVLAAHGSPSDPRPREVAELVTASLRHAGVFRSVACGFIDESPYLPEVADIPSPAICLPFFAARGGHVTGDIPEMLRAAGFDGAVMEPIGCHQQAAELIAATLRRVAALRSPGCIADEAEALAIR